MWHKIQQIQSLVIVEDPVRKDGQVDAYMHSPIYFLISRMHKMMKGVTDACNAM
jgi:hypothetical protein